MIKNLFGLASRQASAPSGVRTLRCSAMCLIAKLTHTRHVFIILELLANVSNAEVVKLVDALASGASRGNPVEVQVLSSAPYYSFRW